MSAPASLSCPKCGLSATQGQRTCDICHAMIEPVNLRRVGLWTAVALEYILVAIVLVSH
jgi:hypothetical protein